MDEDDRFIPLAFSGVVMTAFAVTIATIAGDGLAATSFVVACALCFESFLGRADATGGAR